MVLQTSRLEALRKVFNHIIQGNFISDDDAESFSSAFLSNPINSNLLNTIPKCVYRAITGNCNSNKDCPIKYSTCVNSYCCSPIYNDDGSILLPPSPTFVCPSNPLNQISPIPSQYCVADDDCSAGFTCQTLLGSTQLRGCCSAGQCRNYNTMKFSNVISPLTLINNNNNENTTTVTLSKTCPNSDV